MKAKKILYLLLYRKLSYNRDRKSNFKLIKRFEEEFLFASQIVKEEEVNRANKFPKNPNICFLFSMLLELNEILCVFKIRARRDRIWILDECEGIFFF